MIESIIRVIVRKTIKIVAISNKFPSLKNYIKSYLIIVIRDLLSLPIRGSIITPNIKAVMMRKLETLV